MATKKQAAAAGAASAPAQSPAAPAQASAGRALVLCDVPGQGLLAGCIVQGPMATLQAIAAATGSLDLVPAAVQHAEAAGAAVQCLG